MKAPTGSPRARARFRPAAGASSPPLRRGIRARGAGRSGPSATPAADTCPRYSTGFCVATTMKGCGRTRRSRLDRHRALVHRLEQRRLRLRRGAVDLVGQHDVGEDRPGVELEAVRCRVEDGDADHVGRQRVARELDAPEVEREAPAERPRERRLADARNVLDEHVAAGQKRRQQKVHGPGLAAVSQAPRCRGAGESAAAVGVASSRPLLPFASASSTAARSSPSRSNGSTRTAFLADHDRGVSHARREHRDLRKDEVAVRVGRAAQVADRAPGPDVAPAGVERHRAHPGGLLHDGVVERDVRQRLVVVRPAAARRSARRRRGAARPRGAPRRAGARGGRRRSPRSRGAGRRPPASGPFRGSGFSTKRRTAPSCTST